MRQSFYYGKYVFWAIPLLGITSISVKADIRESVSVPTVVLLANAPAAATAHFERAAVDITVTGRVVDNAGEGLPGVSVLIKGTTTGTTTDMEGRFSLTAPDGNATLVFSFIGFVSQEVALNNRATLNITLAADSKVLDEVVVVGYGTQKRSDVTGAIVNVSEEEIRSRPVANALEAMQGKAAGVDITTNERPGEIGQINIRGVRSLSASNSPLYVVDGIPLMSSSGIETLNPLDIESIDVLKDASATAIYGSRGANGVIIITTKRGKAGKTSLSYSGSTTVENIQDRTQMMDADEYLTWRRWAYHYSDPVRYPRGDQPTQQNDFNIFLGANDPAAWNNIMRGWASGTWDGSQVQTTRWEDMVTQTAVTQIHNLSASGGSDKVRAFGSFGYLDNQGTMKGQYFKRYSSKISVDLIPYDWFEMGASINASYSIQQYGQSTTGGQVSGPGSIYAAARNNFSYAVPFDAEGNRITFPGGDDLVKTVVDEWNYTDNERKMLRTIGSLYAQVNIMPGLRYRANFGPDFRSYTNGIFIDERSVNRLGSPNYASIENQSDFSWTLDNLLFYDKAVGKHSLGATLLQTTSKWNQNSSYMRALGIPLPSQKWNALNTENVPNLNAWDSDLTERQLMSYMGRLNYGFADKYLFTVSGRWDGASQLAEGHKWAFFPSAALAWRLDQEDWMKGIAMVNQLKIRLGVGTTGNSAIAPYQTQGGVVSLFYPYGSSATPGYVPSEYQITDGNLPLANPALGWEKTTQYNLGIDFALLNSRISGVVDVYTSRTSDLLMQMSIPSLTGYTTTYANIGETKNKGIDLTLNTVNVQAGGFTWETSLNAGWQKDEIVSLANGKQDDISNNWFIGQPIGVIYGYASNGLWREGDEEEMARFNANGHNFQVGMSRPVDQNNDYIINPNNDRVIIGHTRPRWTVGLTNNFTFRNFDLAVFLFGRLGYTFNTEGEWQGGRYVQRSISYYNENNKDAEYQKPIYNVAGGDPYSNILGYRSGSFVKIRNINLGYTVPKSVTDKIKIDNLKVYVQARNPGIIYSKIDWLDMDTGLSTWNRGYVVGLNIGF
ncbi:TonB-dependent receptor [Pontibacter sp. 13R65]|uniref:SusC/RagA family TonB-linked outer membrane protein n=1 Tax=Pontibacter sp. 13R65 TaxID=3127458 RepID=UPI00301CA319